MKKIKVLAAKFSFAALTTLTATVSHAGIPVFDGASVHQAAVTAYESVAQTLKQIQQYQTQLQQYENMLKNTMAPSAYIWDQAQLTIGKLRESVDTLQQYKRQLGNIDEYLKKYKDVNFYKDSECFSAKGCSNQAREKLVADQQASSTYQKKANDAILKGIDMQQTAMERDAESLQRLQTQAQSAQGQMQALQAGNQLASHMSNQLLQMRAILNASQNAIITRNQVLADREAMEAAASASARRTTFVRSRAMEW